MRFGGQLDRHARRDARLQQPACHEVDHAPQVGYGGMRAADDFDLLQDRQRRVQLHGPRPHVADDDEAPAGGQRADARREGRRPRDLDHGVGAEAFGDLAHRLVELVVRRGEYVVGAGVLQHRGLVFRARGGDDAQAQQLGDVHRVQADAAAGAGDDHRVAGDQPRALQRVKAGAQRAAEDGAHVQRDARRQRHCVARTGDDQVAVAAADLLAVEADAGAAQVVAPGAAGGADAAGDALRQRDAVARFEAGHQRAHPLDDAGDLVAHHAGQLRVGKMALAIQQVVTADAAGGHPHQHLVFARHRCIHLARLQHLGAAELRQHSGSHCVIPDFLISAGYQPSQRVAVSPMICSSCAS